MSPKAQGLDAERAGMTSAVASRGEFDSTALRRPEPPLSAWRTYRDEVAELFGLRC